MKNLYSTPILSWAAAYLQCFDDGYMSDDVIFQSINGEIYF